MSAAGVGAGWGGGGVSCKYFRGLAKQQQQQQQKFR